MAARIVPKSLIRSLTGFAGFSPDDLEEIVLGEKKETPLPVDSKVSNENAKHIPTLGPPVASTKTQVSRHLSGSETNSLAAKLRRADNAAVKAFKMFDVDGDGTIAVSELGNLAEKLGKDLSEKTIAQIIEQCDRDGDSTLTLNEFKDFFHRFNAERLAEHRKHTNLIKEKLDLNINVSTSAKCSHTCVGAAETACCVYYKHVLLLVSTIVMALMIPFFGSAYNSDVTKLNGYMYFIIWTPFWALYPTWTIVCYYYAFPKRQPVWLLVILAIFYGGVGFLNTSALACPNAALYCTYPDPPVAPPGYIIWRSSMVILASTVNFVLLILYRGPIGFKGLFGFAIFLMCVLPAPPIVTHYFGSSSGSALLTIVVMIGVVVSIRITECMHVRRGGKRIGGSRAYTAMVALVLPNVVQGFTLLMYYAFRSFESTTAVLIFYFIFLMVKLQVRDALAIAVSSSLPDDITTVVFMFFPIFAFQYITELMCLSTGDALNVKFFTFISLKIIMGSMTKGGFLIHWAKSLENWARARRKRHKTRKTLLRGATHAKRLKHKANGGAGDTSASDSAPKSSRGSMTSLSKMSLQSVKRDVACRQAELNCVWVVQRLVNVIFSFLSNTSGQSLHEFKGMSEHQRMVQSTVVTFTLISMSNLSSLACNLGSLVVLLIEQILPPSERVWFKGIGEAELTTTLISFLIVLAANIFVLFVSNWTKYSRWTKLQVLFKLAQLTPHNLIKAKSIGVRKAKAKFLNKLHLHRASNRSHSHRDLLDSAHGQSRASSDEILVDAEYHGKKLYMLERQVFQKHFCLLLLITIYVTYTCASYGIDNNYVMWIKKNQSAFNCNWTLAFNGTETAPPGLYSFSNWTWVCGTGGLPNLNCTTTCAANYPNSSDWDQNCTLYE